MDDFEFGESSSSGSTEDIANGFGEKQSDKKSRQKTFSGLSHQSSRSTLISTTESLVDDFDPEEGGLSNVNVVVRIRPLSDLERKRSDGSCITAQAPATVVIENNSKSKTFTYNAIFDEHATQEDLLDTCGIKQMIEMSVEGYACTVFAYGQTGSGKTHTITGPTGNNGNTLPKVEEVGLIQRSFGYLFEAMGNKAGATFTLYASYLEIYNEQVKDLLNPSSRESLSVRWSKDRGFYVENLFIVECETQDDLLAVLEEGMRQKQMATTNINEHSSRSHTIMSLLVDCEMPDQEEEGLYLTKRGKISFVDLAGSEKVKEIGSSSELISETTNINKSLLTLGNCISSLSDTRKRSGHIPYRDSKLTKLLADSLGGNGITLMVACISPSAYCFAESLSTLRYATRARRIKNKPVVRMDPREKLILSLKREVKLLRAENQYLRQRIEYPAQEPEVQMGITKERPLQSGKGGQNRTEGEQTGPEIDENENQKVPPQLNKRDTIHSIGKSAADNSIYEMIQEYMVENETLRKENVGLQSGKEQSKREQQQLSKENERLMNKLTHLERVISASPVSMHSLSRTTSGHSAQSQSSDPLSPFKNHPVNSNPLSPFMQSPGWGPHMQHQQQQLVQQMQPIPNNNLPQPQPSQSPWAVDYYSNQNKGPLEGQQPSWGNPVAPLGQWRQVAPGQLPPVDSVKGMPDGYRRLQREGQPNQMMRSHQSVIQPHHHHLHQASQSLPAAHGPQAPPLQRNYEPPQWSPKNRPPDVSQSFPPPNTMPKQTVSPKPIMRPLQEESLNPHINTEQQGFINQRGKILNGNNPQISGGIDDTSERGAGRQTQTEIYIPPLGKAQLGDESQEASTTPPLPSVIPNIKQELQPIKDTVSVATSRQGGGGGGGGKSGGVGGGVRVQGNVKGSTKKSLKQQAIQNSAAAGGGGYAAKSKNSPTGLKKGGKKQQSRDVDISSIPRTPSTTPPAVKYVPSGTSEMIAASSSDQSRSTPQSDTLKDINHKLREELQALDGEIEYMKYVNKAETKPTTKLTGKKR
ncbi:uncharacterized protein [Apostichopus japonicus]|uniref:uncharacterized protein isoform X2 n=1 Tax=Stichopus japonicus TaxID=307972 RepID=UPI003AB671C7